GKRTFNRLQLLACETPAIAFGPTSRTQDQDLNCQERPVTCCLEAPPLSVPHPPDDAFAARGCRYSCSRWSADWGWFVSCWSVHSRTGCNGSCASPCFALGSSSCLRR